MFGAKSISGQHVKSTAAIGVKIPSEYTNHLSYGVLFKSDFQAPLIKARWNTEHIIGQPLELTWNTKLEYGEEMSHPMQSLITVNSKFSKTQSQIKSILESPDFKKCVEDTRAGNGLSPICIKLRQQAGSLDHADITLDIPLYMYDSPTLLAFEQLVKTSFFANYKQIVNRHHIHSDSTNDGPGASDSTGHMLPLNTKIQLDVARAGDVAQVKVLHRRYWIPRMIVSESYELQNIRIPFQLQGLLPMCVRNSVSDWLQQKATLNRAPASCRVQHETVSTFDNRTYAYKVNNCEHVLLMDGSRSYPIAVMAKAVSANKKMVTVLAGETKAELIPSSGALIVKVNGAMRTIHPGQVVYEKSSRTGDVVLEIRRYHDGVYHLYATKQWIQVLTNGDNIEIVSSQLLTNRAVGLCGDLNGEVVADLPSPRKCIMKPKFAAMSYMLNKEGTSSSFERCEGIPNNARAEYKRQEQACIKETIVPTSIIPIFEQNRQSSGSGILDPCFHCLNFRRLSIEQCRATGACLKHVHNNMV